MRNSSISIILPVHNEALGISDFINRLFKVVNTNKISCEVICVENGSIDESHLILKRLQKKYKKLKVIQSDKGWGNAVREGVKHSKYQVICFMVSDGQIRPGAIVKVYKKYFSTNYDLVKIKRRNRETFSRKIITSIYNMLGSLLLRIDSDDINGTPKMIKRKVFNDLKIESEDITLDLEILQKLKEKKKKWCELPINSYKRSGGISSTTVKSASEMFKYIAKSFFHNNI